MPSISYAITAHNEYVELERLLYQLNTIIRDIDEVVIQLDVTAIDKVKDVCRKYSSFTVCEFPLNNDFASFKNHLKSKCTRDYIFQIDADEYLSDELLLSLPEILEMNPDIELYGIPRINTVEGLTQDHIAKWGWNVNEKGWVNFPDIQTRIIQNSPKIQWVGKVHEVIYGHSSQAVLPIQEEYCLLHHKHIKRQEVQNTLYSMI